MAYVFSTSARKRDDRASLCPMLVVASVEPPEARCEWVPAGTVPSRSPPKLQRDAIHLVGREPMRTSMGHSVFAGIGKDSYVGLLGPCGTHQLLLLESLRFRPSSYLLLGDFALGRPTKTMSCICWFAAVAWGIFYYLNSLAEKPGLVLYW